MLIASGGVNTQMANRLTSRALAEEYLARRQCDLLVLSGDIRRDDVDALIDVIVGLGSARAANVSLYLTTRGGDAHSAFRLARALRQHYEHLRLLVAGPCKGAGTLVAIGADVVAFGAWGELGPLEAQGAPSQQLLLDGAGLDAPATLDAIQAQAAQAFTRSLSELAKVVPSRTATNVAQSLTSGLFAPLSAQIDPQRLGESSRALEAVTEYARLLGADQRLKGREALEKLTRSYATHDFVIDREQADELFEAIDELDESEATLAAVLSGILRRPSEDGTLSLDLGAALAGSEATRRGMTEASRDDGNGAGPWNAQARQPREPEVEAVAPRGDAAPREDRDARDATSIASEGRARADGPPPVARMPEGGNGMLTS